MSTTFPTSKQTFSNPTANDKLNSPSHASQHADVNDTVEAVQDKLGAGSSTPTSGKFLKGDGTGSSAWTALNGTLYAIIDGGGSAITTGVKLDLPIEFNCDISRVRMVADQAGSIVVDIWKQPYADFPPEDAESITASAPPTISATDKSLDTTLTGWTTSLVDGDVLRFNVDSVTTTTRVTISLRVTKS